MTESVENVAEIFPEDKLTDICAMDHNRWVKEQLDAGFHDQNECTEASGKRPCNKCKGMIRIWSELTKEEQNTVKNKWRAVIEKLDGLGMTLITKNEVGIMAKVMSQLTHVHHTNAAKISESISAIQEPLSDEEKMNKLLTSLMEMNVMEMLNKIQFGNRVQRDDKEDIIAVTTEIVVLQNPDAKMPEPKKSNIIMPGAGVGRTPGGIII